MDRNELLNDNEASLRIALDGRQSIIWTAMPCLVESINFDEMTIVAQPTIEGTQLLSDGSLESIQLPLLLDVPIVFPSGGGFIITFPLAIGDEVLVVFASRCIDAWWQNGDIQRPLEMRMHDLSDGFALPGPKSLPNAISDISSTGLQIRNNAGTTFIELSATGKIGLQNSAASLKGILTDLESLLNTFMGVLALFSGGAAPVTQSSLQAPAAAAVTSLAAVLVKIGNLLE